MTPMTVRELRQALFNLDRQDAPVVLATATGDLIPYVIETPKGSSLPQIRTLAASWDASRDLYVIHTSKAGE